VSARRDPALAAQFPPAKSEAVKPDAAKPATPGATPATPAATPAAADQSAERLAARAPGLEFEIPLYKYESIFKPLEELLEKKPEPASRK
jgi:hypothetical protein